jgi:Gluconate 2-dehydrogenase subunit 3
VAENPDREGRRGFVKKGLMGGALLLLAGGLPIALRSGPMSARPRRPLLLLSPEEYAVFAAVAARIVPGDGAGASWPTAEAVDCAGKTDQLMARAHPKAGAEFRQLLHLFENGLTGLFTHLRPIPFTACTPAQQDARLAAWSRSRIALLRSGYQALKRLTQATYYSSPELYPHIGYPGPPEVPSLPG